MTRFYDIDAANETLPEAREILTVLAEHRLELIRLRDRLLELQNGDDAGGGGEALGRRDVAVADEKRLRLRMQGIIDQMQASVARLEELSITLRDIQTAFETFRDRKDGAQKVVIEFPAFGS